MNATTAPFEHRLAEGRGLSNQDTHVRFADDFKSAALAATTVRLLPPASGKAALYALMMAMWSTIIFGAVMAMAFGS